MIICFILITDFLWLCAVILMRNLIVISDRYYDCETILDWFVFGMCF